MKEEALLKIREEVSKRLTENELYNNRIRRIKELQKLKEVKEYIKLIGETGNNLSLRKEKSEDIVYSCFRHYLSSFIPEEETNKIYVYLGTFQCSSECDINHGVSDIYVSRNSEEADYSLYRNLENYFIDRTISIKDRRKFEEENIVLFKNSINGYELIRREFAFLSYKYGQDVAVKKLIKKYGGNR